MADLYSFVDDIESLPGKIKQLGDVLVRVLEKTTECGMFFGDYTDSGFVCKCIAIYLELLLMILQIVRFLAQAFSTRSKTISDLSSTLSQLREDLLSNLSLQIRR